MGILGNTHIGALNKRKIKEKINGKVLLSFFGGCKHKTFVLLHPTKTSWRQGNRKGLKLQSNTHDIEGLFVKVNLRKTKWLLFYNLSPNNSFRNAFRKKCFRKRAPVELIYRDYNKLNFGDFKTQLKQI